MLRRSARKRAAPQARGDFVAPASRRRVEQEDRQATQRIRATARSGGQEQELLMAPTTYPASAANQINVEGDAGTPAPVNSVNSSGNNTATHTPVHLHVGYSKASDDLSRNVASNLKQKIIAGEYIDLASLLVNSQTSMEERQKIIISQGELLIQPKQQQQKIVDIGSWTDAFLIFISIYCSAHPAKFQDLLKYMNTIRLGAKRSTHGWKIYDEQFRLRKSQDPASSWAVIDQELWLLFMYSEQSVNPVVGSYKCYAFNYRGNCPTQACSYSHSCLRCYGSHPVIFCPRQSFMPNRGAGLGSERFAQPQFRPRSQPRPQTRFQTLPNVHQFNSRNSHNMFRPRF